MRMVLCLGLFIFSFSAWAGGAKSGGERACEQCSIQVLHVGDSQTSGAFGAELWEYLKRQFHESEVLVTGVGGSSPRHWAYPKTSADAKWLCGKKGRINSDGREKIGKHFCQLDENISVFRELNREKPKFVIFQFLGNSMGLSKKAIDRNINVLMSQLKDSQSCMFITSPPYHDSLAERNKRRLATEEYFVQALGDRCRVFRGMSLASISKSRDHYFRDRIHLNQKGARLFMKLFGSELRKFLSRD